MLRSSSLQPTLRACNVGYKRKKLHGKIINKALTRTTNLDINHTYLAKIALKTKDPLYLYQDSTVGYLGDKGSRTPIGVVVKEKTSASDQGTAVALKDCINQGERRSLSMDPFLLPAHDCLQRTILQTIPIWPPHSTMLMATSGPGRLRGRKIGR